MMEYSASIPRIPMPFCQLLKVVRPVDPRKLAPLVPGIDRRTVVNGGSSFAPMRFGNDRPVTVH